MGEYGWDGSSEFISDCTELMLRAEMQDLLNQKSNLLPTLRFSSEGEKLARITVTLHYATF